MFGILNNKFVFLSPYEIEYMESLGRPCANTLLFMISDFYTYPVVVT